MKLHKLNRVHKICFLQHFANGPVWYMDGRGPLATKLSCFVPLSNEDVRILAALCRNEERFEAHTHIVFQGDVPGSASCSHAGWHSATGSCPMANGRF